MLRQYACNTCKYKRARTPSTLEHVVGVLKCACMLHQPMLMIKHGLDHPHTSGTVFTCKVEQIHVLVFTWRTCDIFVLAYWTWSNSISKRQIIFIFYPVASLNENFMGTASYMRVRDSVPICQHKNTKAEKGTATTKVKTVAWRVSSTFTCLFGA